MNNSTLASQYRDAVFNATRYAINNTPKKALENENDILYAYLKHEWQQNLPKFNLLHIRKGNSVKGIQSSTDFRFILFIAAAGLMCYGHKEAIPFVLQQVPKVGNINRLVIMVIDLLPLPENLQDLNKKNEILDWLETHYDQLTWDEEKEVFYLSEEA